MNVGHDKILQGYVDSDARVDRLRRANRYKALQSEMAAAAHEEDRDRLAQRRDVAHAREEALANELKRIQNEELRKDKLTQLMRERAPELRELEAKLHAAATAKERKNQMEAAKLDAERLRESEKVWGDYLLKDAHEYERSEAQKRIDTQAKLREQLEVQKKQMADRQEVLREGQVQYLKEKAEVDAVVAKLQEEDFLETLNKVEKQRATREEHDEFLKQREELLRQERERHRAEEAAIREYMAEQNKRKESGERLKREKEAVKAKVLEEQSSKIALERHRKEELEELINDFYVEQREAKSREDALAEKERRRREKEMMIDANEQQRRIKEVRREQEMAEEMELRRKMMEKFAEDDRIDAMHRVKRQQVKAEHARRVQELIDERRRLREEDRRQEQLILEQAKVAERERELLVAAERERLLREHADLLAEYLPKGVIKSAHDRELIKLNQSKSPGR